MTVAVPHGQLIQRVNANNPTPPAREAAKAKVRGREKATTQTPSATAPLKDHVPMTWPVTAQHYVSDIMNLKPSNVTVVITRPPTPIQSPTKDPSRHAVRSWKKKLQWLRSGQRQEVQTAPMQTAPMRFPNWNPAADPPGRRSCQQSPNERVQRATAEARRCKDRADKLREQHELIQAKIADWQAHLVQMKIPNHSR